MEKTLDKGKGTRRKRWKKCGAKANEREGGGGRGGENVRQRKGNKED